VIVCLLLSSCSFFNKSQKTTSEIKNDSTKVKKETETSSKIDTSKTTTATTKETVYYPQPIYIQGKDGETKVIFAPKSTTETGKQEVQNFNYEDYRKDIVDSMRIANLELALSKKSETKGSLLGIGFWIGISLFGLVLIFLMFMMLKFKNDIVSIKNLIK
jgi:hypothetical protein